MDLFQARQEKDLIAIALVQRGIKLPIALKGLISLMCTDMSAKASRWLHKPMIVGVSERTCSYGR